MIHARKDYDRFQDPALADPSLLSPGSSPIAADEPVMLFRAKDYTAPRVLLAYADLLIAACAERHMIEAVLRHAVLMLEWQRANPPRLPDMPADAGRATPSRLDYPDRPPVPDRPKPYG